MSLVWRKKKEWRGTAGDDAAACKKNLKGESSIKEPAPKRGVGSTKKERLICLVADEKKILLEKRKNCLGRGAEKI